jgi:hypothetical protein
MIKNNIMSEIDLPINAGRILFGLSRIGYTPASAICDLIDNSVMAEAKKIYIHITRENTRFNDNRSGNVKEYLIIDDGKGMNEQMILDALQLGSSDTFYETTTLSKFGLGLKSATFSQGDELEVLSGRNGIFVKYMVSLPEVQAKGKYFASKVDLTEQDQSNINSYFKEGHGTIIKIGKVRKEGHPSVKNTIDELSEKVGVIYFYFIKENGIDIFIDNKLLPAVDILFSDEANTNGNLDENAWNGREVRWIERSKEITLNAEPKISANIEVTQLPHPPTFRNDKRGGDVEVRGKYLIESANYGFYVYRNKRLISWAEGFNGIVPSNQDLYSFRGRILVDEKADDVFNIDVKKSTLTLSDEAWNVISDTSSEYKRKSIKAWGRAKSLIQEKDNEETNQQSNQIIGQLEIPENLPGLPVVDDRILDEAEAEVVEASRRKLEIAKKHIKDDLSTNPDTAGVDYNTPEAQKEIDTTALKGDNNPFATNIFRVLYTEENTLWEPYYDTDHGHCVRINKGHRFAKVLFEDNQDNTDLQVLFELIFHQLAVSEVESLKHLKSSFDKVDIKVLQKILAEYRRLISEYIANMCRKLEDKLPPLNK